MHLINTTTLQLEEFTSDADVPYAILSHRWEREEVLFEDMKTLASCTKAGAGKLAAFCKLACADGHKWCWVDTCCIDKKSSAELSEAINSMFRWYQKSECCYAFMSDLPFTPREHDFIPSFISSVWFKRCWTLQELLAPQLDRIHFYNSSWKRVGSRTNLVHLIAEATKIDVPALLGEVELSQYSIAERMAWASDRKATRIEDQAYSLMGIFDVNMPMLYGEGLRAFERLQEEIIKYSNDETIFAWSATDEMERVRLTTSGLLASSPSMFRGCGGMKATILHEREAEFSLTSRGLTSSLMVARSPPKQDQERTCLAFLNAAFRDEKSDQFVGITLQLIHGSDKDSTRLHNDGGNGAHRSVWTGSSLDVQRFRPKLTKIHVRHRGSVNKFLPQELYGFDLTQASRSMVSPTVFPNPADECRTVLAPSATTSHDGNKVIRLDQQKSGPVCNLYLSHLHYSEITIQLGISSALRPVVLIPDQGLTMYHEDSKGISLAAALPRPSLSEVTRFQVNYENLSWERHDEVVPKKRTGLYAIEGSVDHKTIVILQLPEKRIYKKAACWVIKLTPMIQCPQNLWGISFYMR